MHICNLSPLGGEGNIISSIKSKSTQQVQGQPKLHATLPHLYTYTHIHMHTHFELISYFNGSNSFTWDSFAPIRFSYTILKDIFLANTLMISEDSGLTPQLNEMWFFSLLREVWTFLQMSKVKFLSCLACKESDLFLLSS